jgi:hypothetical protein
MKQEIKNAANESQVEKAKTADEKERELELADLRFLLGTPQGRRFVWRILRHCRVFNSVFNNSGSVTYYHSGMQDVGHFIQAEVIEAKKEAYFEMMRENEKGSK